MGILLRLVFCRRQGLRLGAVPKDFIALRQRIAFAEKLSKSELKHDAVQCPNSTDQSSVSVMRDHTISFNQEHGMTIVTLNWQL